MGAEFYLGLAILILGVVMLCVILTRKQPTATEHALDMRGRVALRDDAPPSEMLVGYCDLAVRAVEQQTRAGNIPRDNIARKKLALEYVKDYAQADRHNLTDCELEAVKSMVEASVLRLREEAIFDYRPPDAEPQELIFTRRKPDDVLVEDGIDLDTLSYEQLMLFAMDNGFGVPEDGELHGQNKAEIRQSMLDWLEKRLTKCEPAE